MLRLHLIRHGHTIWHTTGGVAGRSDIDLSKDGERAVIKLAKTWQDHEKLYSWYCSPLVRTRHTTQLLRHNMLCQNNEFDRNEQSAYPPVQLDERLVELDFGVWEGMRWQDVHTQYEKQMRHWGEDWVKRSPPGGETFAEQALRCRSWLSDLIAKENLQSKHGDGQGRTAIAVLHAGSIRALVCEILDWPLTRAMAFNVDPATLTTLEFEPGKSLWTLRRLNSLSFAR